MFNVIQGSKYQNETISIVLDFSDELEVGEVVSTCTFLITLITGTDPTPNNILYQTYSPIGTKVDQKFRLGVPGVIYEITWQVVGSLGTIVEKFTPLAILPVDGIATPGFTFIYLTSFIYPYNAQDILAPSMTPRKAYAFAVPVEKLLGGMSPSQGSIFGSVGTYNIPPEQLAPAMLPTSGSLFGSSTTYNVAVEIINPFCAPVVGSLFGSSISYNDPAEGLIPSMLPTHGTIA